MVRSREVCSANSVSFASIKSTYDKAPLYPPAAPPRSSSRYYSMNMEDPDELEGGGEQNHPLPKDLMFDHWASLAPAAERHVEPMLIEVLQALAPEGGRARRDLVDGIAAIVPAIIANLLVLHHEHPKGSRLVIEMERRKRTRYDRPGFRKLPEVLRALQAGGHIVRHAAVYRKLRTTIEASQSLRSFLQSADIALPHVIRVEGEETIRVTARAAGGRIAGKKRPKVVVDYADSVQAIALRREMDGINRFLSAHEVTLEDEPKPAFRLVRLFTLRRPNDPASFDLHGRLYGGFWMNLKATERHRLRIDGEPIADLDFSSMFPRLAYQHVGKEPPQGDLYAIPGLENHRDGSKAALSALLSYEAEMKSLPSRLKAQLPDGWTAGRVKQAFAAAHPNLVPLFGRDFGLDLMFTESRILLATLRRLMAQGIAALPMHDGIMVPASRSREGMAAMEDASEEIAGLRLPVTLKTEH